MNGLDVFEGKFGGVLVTSFEVISSQEEENRFNFCLLDRCYYSFNVLAQLRHNTTVVALV